MSIFLRGEVGGRYCMFLVKGGGATCTALCNECQEYRRLCQALGLCRWVIKPNEKRKKRASSEKASEQKTAGRRRGDHFTLSSKSSRGFSQLFFSIRFPHYLGAWNRLRIPRRNRDVACEAQTYFLSLLLFLLFGGREATTGNTSAVRRPAAKSIYTI